MPVVKIGVSRQVVIPKKLHKQLGLVSGDYLEVEVKGRQIVLTPKTLVEKDIAEGLEDFKKGRASGPFSAKDAIRHLHRVAKKAKKKPQQR